MLEWCDVITLGCFGCKVTPEAFFSSIYISCDTPVCVVLKNVWRQCLVWDKITYCGCSCLGIQIVEVISFILFGYLRLSTGIVH